MENSPQKYTRVVYVGDGLNDLCPLLQLNSTDVGVVRRGFSLDKALTKGSHDMKAMIRIGDFLQELGAMISSLCHH